jgi:hypothetical protein
MSNRVWRLAGTLITVLALGLSGTAFAATGTRAQRPAQQGTEQENGGEAPESTGPENSAADPDNIQFEDSGQSQGDNGNAEPQNVRASHNRRHKAAQKHVRHAHKRASARGTSR